MNVDFFEDFNKIVDIFLWGFCINFCMDIQDVLKQRKFIDIRGIYKFFLFQDILDIYVEVYVEVLQKDIYSFVGVFKRVSIYMIKLMYLLKLLILQYLEIFKQ